METRVLIRSCPKPNAVNPPPNDAPAPLAELSESAHGF